MRYTEGFSPRPKLSFGLALPTGYESEAEYLEVDLEHAADVDGLAARIGPALPSGIVVLGTELVDRDTDALQEAITACTWQLDIASELSSVEDFVAATLEADRIIVDRERKGRPSKDDVRPQVVALDAPVATPTGARLCALLGTKPRTLRPTELVTAIAPTLTVVLVRRLHQWIEQDGDRREPIPVDAPQAVRLAS